MYVKVLDLINSFLIININLLFNVFKVRIVELVSVGVVVVYVGVMDEDIGWNGYVICFFSNLNFWFDKFDVNEYKVVVNVELDWEKIDEYEINVICVDFGILLLSLILIFRVMVMDMNDYFLMFLKIIYYVEFYENNEIGVEVLRVLVLDFDIGINVEIEYFFF